jgi:hypothetical protein
MSQRNRVRVKMASYERGQRVNLRHRSSYPIAAHGGDLGAGEKKVRRGRMPLDRLRENQYGAIVFGSQ